MPGLGRILWITRPVAWSRQMRGKVSTPLGCRCRHPFAGWLAASPARSRTGRRADLCLSCAAAWVAGCGASRGRCCRGAPVGQRDRMNRTVAVVRDLRAGLLVVPGIVILAAAAGLEAGLVVVRFPEYSSVGESVRFLVVEQAAGWLLCGTAVWTTVRPARRRRGRERRRQQRRTRNTRSRSPPVAAGSPRQLPWGRWGERPASLRPGRRRRPGWARP